MTEYTRVVEEEEDGIGIMKALAILSAHEHRETSLCVTCPSIVAILYL
jgi:hypothetical protein